MITIDQMRPIVMIFFFFFGFINRYLTYKWLAPSPRKFLNSIKFDVAAAAGGSEVKLGGHRWYEMVVMAKMTVDYVMSTVQGSSKASWRHFFEAASPSKDAQQ